LSLSALQESNSKQSVPLGQLEQAFARIESQLVQYRQVPRDRLMSALTQVMNVFFTGDPWENIRRLKWILFLSAVSAVSTSTMLLIQAWIVLM
jgi:hypothetical protein